jgi:rhodanese-related sulfurtransferase
VIVRVDAVEARQLIGDGIVVLDALPRSIWEREHLPGARSQPLEDFQPRAVEDLDRDETLLVYCFDQHCDLSARLCRRLDELGFGGMHDLIGGRGAWTAMGYPTEGSVGDRRRIPQYVTTVDTIPLPATIADLRALGAQAYPTPVVTDDGILVGALADTARRLPASTPVRDVMFPAPGTIRPEMRVDEVVDQLARDGLDHVFVTAVNGTLIGLAIASELHA